ncbi:glycosyltransferase [Sphingobacterium hotanense]|uniref:Glycosyltransferase n=1 Tax=Sphingobacterium hotanense TaxID=649196 RepID=A0ABT7NRL3_9SPHI|nr:glycosyltransferase [Sphingobacterium hotanense]MDM1049867.1 glycosyltransferase [Sphingobacterium hotanense]
MDKICFLVCQYGKEVNGGAEYHCKMLAERLVGDFQVDILTTKTINYHTFEPYYKNNQETINGVNILRFDCIDYSAEEHGKWRKKTKFPRKVRRNLFRMGLLETAANMNHIWDMGIKNEEMLLKTHGFYSPDLLNYLEANKDSYKAIILMSYVYPHTIFGSRIAPEKTILIPTVHNEGDIFRSIQTHLFTSVKHIGFNTEEERNLARKIFGNKMSESSILAVGIETEFENSISKTEIQKKFTLPERYLHYFGRICNSKMDKLIPWFIRYKEKFPSNLKLVLTGRLFQEKVEHPDIIYTGFVTDEEKIALVKNATLIINPSRNESLSLLLLEAMKLGKTVLVNKKSDVMVGHAIRSDYAAEPYGNEKDFQEKIRKHLEHPELNEESEIKAKNYVDEHYSWPIIMGRIKHLISTI